MSESCCICAGVSACAEATSALTSPRSRASSARKLFSMSAAANRRRFLAISLRKLAVSPEMPALARSAVSALAWSSAEITGLRTRRRRSWLSSNMR